MIFCPDLLEDAGEISDILSRSYATPDYVDEADLEAELACLGDEFEEIDAAPVPTKQEELPQAPSTTLPSSSMVYS